MNVGLNEKRSVVHFDLDTFFVSVERLMDRRLEGIPLMIGGTGGRGVVSSCSYEARVYGVRSGMPMKMAQRICPIATVISGDHEAYSRYSGMVTDIIRSESPVFEKASIDEFYVDLTGMERFHGTGLWATKLREKVIQETGLPISYGLSINKSVAKVATNEAKPGAKTIPKGEVQAFLDPLAVQKLPMVGEKTTQFLVDMGIRQVRTLREMPREILSSALGRTGEVLWQRARGIDDSLVIPYDERKSVSTERTFGEDTIDVPGLRATLTRMAEQLSFSLRSGTQLTACVTVKVRYADFNTETKQATIPYTAADHTLVAKALELFERLYDRRLRVRLIGLSFSHLVHGGHQVQLFEDTEKQLQLYSAMDKIRYRFGSGAVTRASTLGGVDSRRRTKIQ